jgi:hypothetical protein
MTYYSGKLSKGDRFNLKPNVTKDKARGEEIGRISGSINDILNRLQFHIWSESMAEGFDLAPCLAI